MIPSDFPTLKQDANQPLEVPPIRDREAGVPASLMSAWPNEVASHCHKLGVGAHPAYTSFHFEKVAACPRRFPSRSMSCQTTPSSIQKRRPDFVIRRPR